MITCKKAGPLMEKEEFEKLPLMKRWGLKFHLAWCKLCHGYKADSSHLNEIIKTADSSKSKSCLSHEEKSEMKQSIAK